MMKNEAGPANCLDPADTVGYPGLRRKVMNRILIHLLCILLTVSFAVVSRPGAAAPGRPAPKERIIPSYPRDTDPLSLRHSQLRSAEPCTTEVIRVDINHDGKPEILECWWYGKRARWFDANDDMTTADCAGDKVGDIVQVDRDGDSFYDGPDDLNVRWIDEKGSGKADWEVMALNPSATDPGDPGRFMILPDTDNDNVMVFIDWEKFQYHSYVARNSTNLRVKNYRSNFQQDYNGNSTFFWTVGAPGDIEDPRSLWENPFCFYDLDSDGCSEMTVRIADDESMRTPRHRTHRRAQQVHVSYDLDNDTGRGNETDYDMTLRFQSREGLDFSKRVQKHPRWPAPAWVLPYFRYTNWLTMDEMLYISREECHAEAFKAKWESISLTFDEDDDDHRWERVESYEDGDPYSTKRCNTGSGVPKGCGLCAGHQSDTLGDRGEFDRTGKGKARLYVGTWDNKIHLYGADWGAWTVDYGAMYWGAYPCVGDSSPDSATSVSEVVQYYDTDNNGFIDKITWDYDGDKVVDLEYSVRDSESAQTTATDFCELIDPATAGWQGLHQLFQEISEKTWQQAHLMYNAAWKARLMTPELDALAIATTPAEKYDKGYWLKEKIFRMIDGKLKQIPGAERDRARFHHMYFSGDIKAAAAFIGSRSWI